MTSESETSHPVGEAQRIEALDVFRGFALLGILLLNILGFGLHSASYSNPGFDLIGAPTLDVVTWASVELFAEGAMRALFSMLFGAGVVLFTSGRKNAGVLHYRRTGLLLLFGLIDGYLLLWNGDILVAYAVGGAILFWFRNIRAGWMFVWACLLVLLISAENAVVASQMKAGFEALQVLEATENPEELSPQLKAAAAQWQDMVHDFEPSAKEIVNEFAMRKESYASAFAWNAGKETHMLTFVLPVFYLWDGLAMMLFGMALYKSGVLHGKKPRRFYGGLAVCGLTIGLLINGYEVHRAWVSDFDIFMTMAQMQPTYHIGRLGMAFGYIGLLGLLVKSGAFAGLRARLAATGRMALSNYLMHSVIALFIFTGAGLAFVGDISRAGLYPIVFAIWALQLVLSPWWLKRYQYGPLEWVWRALTYGTMPPFKRKP